MNLKTLVAASAVMLSLGAGSASAATFTYDYTGGATNASGPSLGCAAGGLLNVGCSVTFNSDGLGVYGAPDTQPDQIDGNPIFSSETLRFDFGFDRSWDSILFGRWDSNDDLTVTWDGGSATWGPGVAALLELGGIVSSFLEITATGTFWADGFISGNDSFTAAQINVSSVPVPAALPLMAGGLGLLGLVGRRRKRSASTEVAA